MPSWPGSAKATTAARHPLPTRRGAGWPPRCAAPSTTAGSIPGELSYIAAHGSATWSGDSSEAHAIRQVLGPARVPVSAVKPQTGHLVGGAGALNVAVAALALHHGAAPATLNLDDPDPRCDLDHVRSEPLRARFRHAIALARGFEGQATALALTAAD